MALASVGGGYQNTDGNQSEQTIGVQAAPQTATATATLTVAQVTGGLLVGNPSTSAATYTLPTAALLDATMTNMKVNSTFGCGLSILAPVPASLRSLLAPALLRLVTSLSQLRAARLALVARQSFCSARLATQRIVFIG
jgi:hypothetical protein